VSERAWDDVPLGVAAAGFGLALIAGMAVGLEFPRTPDLGCVSLTHGSVGSESWVGISCPGGWDARYERWDLLRGHCECDREGLEIIPSMAP
jgi:hypothetical protein